MIATVAVVSGLQLLLAFLGYDIANVPRRTLHSLLHPEDSSVHHQAACNEDN